jgi:hypothetical protein
MAYQPLFVEFHDVNGSAGQTHSCRQKVTWASGRINTDIGELCKLYAGVKQETLKGPRGGDLGEKTKSAYMDIEVHSKAKIKVLGNVISITMEA